VRVSKEHESNQSINQSNSFTSSFACTSAPHFSIKYCTTSKCPLKEAKWRGVNRFCNAHITCKNGNPITQFCEIVLKLRECGTKTNQSINQIHSLQPSHSHQLHISQSNIAPRPNVHWMMQSGEACNHPAMLTLRIFNTSTCKNGNPIPHFCGMVLKLRECGTQN
jgi:hypothetical protein